MASPKLDSEFNEALLDTYSDEEVIYHFVHSPKLTTTRIESIRVLSYMDYTPEKFAPSGSKG
jgi:hypothetical protein